VIFSFRGRIVFLFAMAVAALLVATPLVDPGQKPMRAAAADAVRAAGNPKTSARTDRRPAVRAPRPAAPSGKVFTKAAPEDITDLLAIQSRVRDLVRKVMPATVGLRIGRAQGSGVIVTADGYVLTAGHVSAKPGRSVVLILADGRRIKGETLGSNRTVDAGLVRITDPGPWPFVKMGDMAKIHTGDWCLAMGHPGGYQRGRPPVVRLGRVLRKRDSVIQSDCTLVGGDSGGPLFDMQGRVIGIHSRIGKSASWNFHVPIASYHKGWDRLAAGEVWGSRPKRPTAVLGVDGEDDPRGCKVTKVAEGLPAARIGVKVGDIIVKFNNETVKGIDHLALLVQKKRPGTKVSLTVLRKGKTLRLTAILAARRTPKELRPRPQQQPEQKQEKP